jgi:outer membrane receptor protein involved in Fe transport
MLLSSEAPDARCSRLAAIALALVLCVGALPARAVDPEAPASPDGAERAPAESPSGDPTGEAAEQGETPRAAPPQEIEVIRITGKTLAGIETEVPASVTQFNPEDLAALGAQDVSDVARFTPSLEINTYSPTTPTFFIRGVGLNDFNANAAGAVAIYLDGVPINAPALQLGGLYDVENVEILRGPQGWGDDRNASSGARDAQVASVILALEMMIAPSRSLDFAWSRIESSCRQYSVR